MRVLILTNLYPNRAQPHRAAFNRQQFGALARRHDVRIISPVPWTTRVRLGSAATAVAELGGPRVEHPVYFFPPKGFRGWYGPCYRRSAHAAFRRAVAEMRPDVALGSWAYPDGWAAVHLARECQIPVAIKAHGSDILTLGNLGSARAKRTREAVSSADAVVAVGEQLASRVEALGARRVYVVPNGIDTTRFSPGSKRKSRDALGLDSDAPTVLFVGNLVPVKGPDLLLEAVSLASRELPNLKCIVAGEGPLRATLERRAASLDLAGRVLFVGSRPQDELPDWYRAADTLVLPSRSEGTPNVLLEASACGTPFVATRVGGVSEVAGDALLVPPGDPAAMARGILSTLTLGAPRIANPTRRPSWDESAAALAGALASAIGIHARAAA
jgi:glycosyltransferase involved in cell wall biosynthesis